MLLIEAVANTMIVVVCATFAIRALRHVLVAVQQNSFAKIARVEAQYLDEQYRQITE